VRLLRRSHSPSDKLALRSPILFRISFPDARQEMELTNYHRWLPAAPTAGSLFEPMHEGTGVSGGWKADGGTSMRRAALIGAAIAAPALLVWRRLRKTWRYPKRLFTLRRAPY
jgi:hypothetical protein